VNEFLQHSYGYMWLILALPIAAFGVMFGVTYENRRLSAWIGIIAALVADLVSIWVLLAELARPQHLPQGLGIFTDFITFADFHLTLGILADPLAAMMVVVVCSVSFLIQLYSLEYMRGEEGFVRYYAFISLFTFSMLLLVLSPNFFQTYIGWELVGVCSYLLIGHYFKKASAAAAAKKAFLVTRLGDFPFLVGIGYIFFRFHDLDFFSLASHHVYTAGLVGTSGLFVMGMLVFSGAVGKSAQFPLHVWLPDAMEGPTPISALIHAATMVAAGVYLVARAYDLFAASPAALAMIATIGAVTSLMAAIWAVGQDDIKRIVAYSTISHLGLMMFGLGVGAYSAAVFHLFTHAWFKALLFLAAGSVIHAVHTQDIWEMGGLGRRMRWTTIATLVGCVSAAGIFPLAGFWSKDGIMSGVFAMNNPAFIVVAMLITFFSALYTFRLFFVVFTGETAKRRAFDPKRIHENGPYILAPLAVLAVMAAVAGLWGSPLFGHEGFGNFIFYGQKPVVEPDNIPAIAFSLTFALLGVVVAALFYYPPLKRFSAASFNRRFPYAYAWSHNKGYFDEVYRSMFVGLALVGGRAVEWVDKHLVDGFVDGLADGYSLGARYLRRLQTGRVQAYAGGVFVGVLVVAVLAMLLGSNGALASIGGPR
jgi:NADH-quinone oxidoreductase subunit L